jgi:hypothetical protein
MLNVANFRYMTLSSHKEKIALKAYYATLFTNQPQFFCYICKSF